jgi:hypothetical protein
VAAIHVERTFPATRKHYSFKQHTLVADQRRARLHRDRPRRRHHLQGRRRHPSPLPRLHPHPDGHGALRRPLLLLLRVPEVRLHEVPAGAHVPPVREKHRRSGVGTSRQTHLRRSGGGGGAERKLSPGRDEEADATSFHEPPNAQVRPRDVQHAETDLQGERSDERVVQGDVDQLLESDTDGGGVVHHVRDVQAVAQSRHRVAS